MSQITDKDKSIHSIMNCGGKSYINGFSTQHHADVADMTSDKDVSSSMVADVAISYNTTLYELDESFKVTVSMDNSKPNIHTGLRPIIKWPGGKEKELKYILPNLPDFNRYFEPFVGGGSVFMAVQAKEYYINDFSSELVSLYNHIATSNKAFSRYIELIDESWEDALKFFNGNQILVEIYQQYRDDKISKDELKFQICQFCKDKKSDILNIIDKSFFSHSCILLKEMETNLFRKMQRMRELEIKKYILPDRDLFDNIETAIKSAVYMNYRHMYNDPNIIKCDKALHCALFFFLRNYSYSGMFRYSSKGDFNVPYGGIAYNSKLMSKKLNYYRSIPLLSHFADTHIYNLDFESFLKEVQPNENDFVFLDPPYDSEFSTYAQNTFTKADHERLADFMINECKAKWMLIIKNTNFIYDLYNKKGINIRTFDKEYLVSFMNRNDKKVTHLLITNY